MSRIERVSRVQGPLLWYVLSISLATLSSCAIPSAVLAQDPTVGNVVSATSKASMDTVGQMRPTVKAGYGDKGFEFATTDGNFLLHIESRLQFRYAFPGDENPVTFEAFQGSDRPVFKINRARLKVGGFGFKPWLRFYWEYELAAANLLDFRLTLVKLPILQLKVGQWKAHFNRERIISSGKQQLADRSLINRSFTIDRQIGISLFGRLQGGGAADFNYWASVFTGTGRGATENDDSHLMYMLRVQWNFLGRELRFSGSDLKYHAEGAGLLALAAVTNQSPYTRFSQAGGGQLPSFEAGEPGQYRVKQWMAETALKYRGFAWQQEFHWKQIQDHKNQTFTTLVGNYLQLGYFFHHAWAAIPPPLEVAVRYTIYDPNVDLQDDRQEEFSLAGNWFFAGHRNKLTLELAHLVFEDDENPKRDGFRIRLQWDVSI